MPTAPLFPSTEYSRPDSTTVRYQFRKSSIPTNPSRDGFDFDLSSCYALWEKTRRAQCSPDCKLRLLKDLTRDFRSPTHCRLGDHSCCLAVECGANPLATLSLPTAASSLAPWRPQHQSPPEEATRLVETQPYITTSTTATYALRLRESKRPSLSGEARANIVILVVIPTREVQI